MEILYHYCSVLSFLAIAQSKKLWLSDASKMNDSHEGNWADHIVDRELTRRRSTMTDQDREQCRLGHQITKPRAFLFCMSSEADVLSQWRGYADDAMGVAIGFSRSTFPVQQHLPSTNAAPSHNTALWPVIYDEDVQNQIIEDTFQKGLTSPDVCIEPDGKPDYYMLGMWLARFGPLFKNPAFHEEKEFRVVHTPMLLVDEKNSHHTLGTNYPIGQRVSRNQIVTHFEFPLPENLSGVVREVWIGPRSRLSRQDIELTLAINGFGSVAVHHSSATYR
ncbi:MULTISPECIES: DUF2971 domain-containing protein [unclassified Hydrogenophaga]|uniref:DUF2971 domain-containing protein n=1 Tax=unclassified Hydrogenophaga TaxID=2610897 RepID=UPI000B0DC1FB|nr:MULTISPECIES: DUF2971 domain-containing protein [unclassified Hydrogenophaga]MBN9373030.1 DUF2971 domain-containing protein [Hydrogenophaga sp.]